MSERGWLQADTIRGFGTTKLRARSVLEGVLAGLHRSPHRGASVEFAEYKEYMPGDEIRHIDWRAYGRVDRYYVRQYEDETNTRGFFLLDTSGSMRYGWEEGEEKLSYASRMAAALAWLFLRQGDAPGLLTFAEGPGVWLPPSTRRTQLDDICHILDAPPTTRGTSVSGALQRIAEQARFRSIVALFSDLLDPDPDLLRFARILRARGSEVVVFHILDRSELTLPHEGMTIFEGLEDDGSLLVDPDDIRGAYLDALDAHIKAIEQTCLKGDIEYFRCVTDEPAHTQLLAFLNGRARRKRGGRR